MNARFKAPDAWTPQSAKEWYDWLVEEVFIFGVQ